MGPGKAIARPEQQVIVQKRKAARRGFEADPTSESPQRKKKTRGPKDRVFLKRFEKLSAWLFDTLDFPYCSMA
jgi:hypothetical protein